MAHGSCFTTCLGRSGLPKHVHNWKGSTMRPNFKASVATVIFVSTIVGCSSKVTTQADLSAGGTTAQNGTGGSTGVGTGAASTVASGGTTSGNTKVNGSGGLPSSRRKNA